MRKVILALLSLVFIVPLVVSPDWAVNEHAAAATDRAHPDIVIIGSEMEGMYLARAAADEGLSVLVLDPHNKPGGQLIQGEMVFLDEPFGDNGELILQGRVKELFDLYKQGQVRKIEEFRRYFDRLAKGIPIVSGITITGLDIRRQPDASRRTVESITYTTPGGREETVYPGYVVENTDFAALTSQLDLPRIPGMESIVGSNPASKDYMAATFMMKFKRVDWEAMRKSVMGMSQRAREQKYGTETTVTGTMTWGFGKIGAAYDPGSNEWFLRGLNIVNQRDGEVTVNALLVYNLDPSNVESVATAIEQGKEQTKRIIGHLRNQLPGWAKAEINGYPDYLYIRDSDRYETEYVLQGTDLMSARMFEDNVSIAGYPIDIQGTSSSKWGTRLGNPDKYGMPLRSFLSKGYTNVIVAGKNVGASAVAYGSARIQAQTALAAETIGIMLGRMKGQPGLADLDAKQMAQMHQYLRTKYKITLTGIKGKDKLTGMNDNKRELFDRGKLIIP
ncbi:FAD-dependent oxidoreductase [Cohnella pontilimi]|uniref:FAD-dependent oxidoreductase n=1 Tax=Cohnella pontilimi TaxID=2564100 RepID=A0A4U0FG74_9BACL|nr:FAD-dependent oxidoreductase [Cohnella pontilimi]TJY43917.1 FAD-dependent oxidoreductase [Cohnella pontilimi]